jgi:hypothetical protein
MGGYASTETRKIKIAATEQLIRRYDVNLCLFVELTAYQLWALMSTHF